jgi:hypothetical protein
LDVAVERKYAAPESRAGGAVGKMFGDAFAVLENMPIAIDNFQLLCHEILLRKKLCADVAQK